jgi:hypothetical protein
MLVVAIALIGCRNGSCKPAPGTGTTYELTVPRVFFSPVSIRDLDEIFQKARPGETITVRLKKEHVGVLEGISCDEISVENGEAVFYSQDGEFRFAKDKKVAVKPKLPTPERVFGFQGSPNIFLAFGKTTSYLGLDRLDWDQREVGEEMVPYYSQHLTGRDTWSNGTVVELKFHLSNDYAGHIGGWEAYRAL